MRAIFCLVSVLVALPLVAHAQYEGEAVPEETPVATTDTSSPDVGSTGSRMGVGVESMASSFSGPAFVYDAGEWHIDAILSWAVVKDSTDRFRIGGRFWYVLKSSAQADLSLGGGLAFARESVEGVAMDESANVIILEAGAKIRVFLVRQVALTGTFGAALALGEQDSFALRGDAVGSFGLVYFFR